MAAVRPRLPAAQLAARGRSVGKMPKSVLQLDSAAAARNAETVSANSAAGWRRFLACLDSLLAGVDACDLAAKGALAVLTKLVWENMKTRCATSRQRLLSRLTTVERAWRPLVSDILTCDIQYIV